MFGGFNFFRKKQYFWSDVSRGVIESMNFDGSDRKILLNRDVSFVEGIAVEWVTQKLYWVSFLSFYRSQSSYNLLDNLTVHLIIVLTRGMGCWNLIQNYDLNEIFVAICCSLGVH